MTQIRTTTLRHKILKIHPKDNVAVAVDSIDKGERLLIGREEITSIDKIMPGHKCALKKINSGEHIVKYGHVIGRATIDIRPGEWVHSHNVETNLTGTDEYRFTPAPSERPAAGGATPTFLGYRRGNGRVGIRNEIWIINTVGCVNSSANRIAELSNALFHGPNLDGVHSFSHQFGCSQLGDDLRNTRRILAGLMRNPNAGGVLVLGLGCENNRLASLLEEAGDLDPARVRSFNSQSVADEINEGVGKIRELVEVLGKDRREEVPVSELTLGVKCGGSDGFSGITANPLVGRITDLVTSYGGRIVLSEVPEMFGAERALMERAADESIFEQIVWMINRFKKYFLEHDQPVYENPSPGNKEGGLTTLEEKSLGAIQKGGRATVTGVLNYGDQVGERGLALLESPGNDGVSSTAMTAAGATLLLFTTGRGTPLGSPVPTIKVSTNTDIFRRKPNWIDFNAGEILDGTKDPERMTEEFFKYILDVASGRAKTRNEVYNYREIAIWKEGVTL